MHGGYADAWCWEPYFLPWFAAQGWPAHALSLRGHGASRGADALFVAGLDDYVADVEHVASQLDSAPVLIGHSMGAAVLERMMATRPVRGAVLMAPVPPMGLLPVAARLAATHPNYASHMVGLDPSRLSHDLLKALRPFYFSRDVDPRILREAIGHLNQESPRVLFDLSMRLHWIEPQATSPVFVMGAAADQIATPADVEATAQPPWREVPDPARHGSHADAGARMAHGRAGDRRLGRRAIGRTLALQGRSRLRTATT